MDLLMNDGASARLERSCATATADWLRIAPSSPGLERVEAFFAGHAFDPHRHDTYAIGFTLAGIQSFTYRGVAQHSLPGQTFVLHPDETHDGHAGTGAGFRYRILYVEPRLIRDALGSCRPLPFVREPVSSNPGLAAVFGPALRDLDLPLEDLQRDQIVLSLAEALAAADPSVRERPLSTRDWRAVNRARNLLDAGLQTGITSTELEAASCLSRYALARQFRACLGTSPYRYLIMRRLERARSLIGRGASLVDAALISGFADQSHMTRHFKRTYGMPPGRWAALSARQQ